MSTITAKDIQALRQATGAGMMDAKRALTDSEGDVERAKDLLRERGLYARRRSGSSVPSPRAPSAAICTTRRAVR